MSAGRRGADGHTPRARARTHVRAHTRSPREVRTSKRGLGGDGAAAHGGCKVHRNVVRATPPTSGRRRQAPKASPRGADTPPPFAGNGPRVLHGRHSRGAHGWSSDDTRHINEGDTRRKRERTQVGTEGGCLWASKGASCLVPGSRGGPSWAQCPREVPCPGPLLMAQT